jgi:hypothetical protein
MGTSDVSCDIPAELKDAVVSDKLIIFAGAGLSYKLKNRLGDEIGGWNNLVQKMLENLSSCGHDVALLQPLVNNFEAIKILDLIENNNPRLPKKNTSDFIKDFFELSDENDFSLHKKLTLLSKKIITTNYDTAFELAAPEYRKYRAFKGTNYELTTHKEPNAKLLYKLHGCYEHVDSLVLFPSQYKTLYENTQRDSEHALMVMKNIIMNYTVLFIGTGMGDFQINSLFKEIENLQGEYNQQHFIITNQMLDSSLSFLKPLKINNYKEIEAIVDKLINIAEKNKGSSRIELEKQLLDAHREIELLKQTQDSDENREKIALKSFIRGVSYSLENEPEKAADEYEIVTCIQPMKHEAWYNWGTDLGKLAATKDWDEADTLYREAFDKYDRAVQTKEDKHEAWNNWGIAIGKLAATKDGDEADTLYREAFDKYDRAVEIKEDQYESWSSWGVTLGNFAATKDGDEAKSLYAKGIDKLHLANKLSGKCYNLACVYALQSSKIDALKYLEISLNNNEISKEFVLSDEDWLGLYDDADFKSILADF